MKDIIWLSPSLAAGAIAARLVVFFKRRPQIRSRRGVKLTVPSRPYTPSIRLCALGRHVHVKCALARAAQDLGVHSAGK